jgi:hypothetical protein
MTNQHPVTPPPDKIHNWLQLEKVDCTLGQIITIAAQWGADQELEACVSWLIENQNPRWAHALRTARRPKPSSLKEQALAAVESGLMTDERLKTIRRALEALPND